MSLHLLLLPAYRQPRHDRVPPPPAVSINSARRLLLIILQSLLPLLTCCLLALLGTTSVSAAMQGARLQPPNYHEQHEQQQQRTGLISGPEERSLDQNGSLTNASSPRWRIHTLYDRWQPFVAQPPPPRPAKSVSDVKDVSSGGYKCNQLTYDIAERLCSQLAAGQLASLAANEAAHSLRFCRMFDFRKVLHFADSLTVGDVKCAHLLMERERQPNKARCLDCLKALIQQDELVEQRSEQFDAVLDRYQCYSRKTSPSSSSATSPPYATTSPSSSSSSTSPPSSSDATSQRRTTNITDSVNAGLDVSEQYELTSPKRHAGSSNCTRCKETYKDWLCTGSFQAYPFALSDDSDVNRSLIVEPCAHWCADVETHCPYFTPAEDQQNGGEPVFLCSEAHYHHSSRYQIPTNSCTQHRHRCCYIREDVGCYSNNCTSLRDVCDRYSYYSRTTDSPSNSSNSSVSSDSSSSGDTSSSSHKQQQDQQQYSSPADTNGSATTNVTASSSARRTSVVDLILLPMVAYCCYILELT